MVKFPISFLGPFYGKKGLELTVKMEIWANGERLFLISTRFGSLMGKWYHEEGFLEAFQMLRDLGHHFTHSAHKTYERVLKENELYTSSEDHPEET